MKKILYLTLLIILITGCSQSKKNLYKETDEFVSSLKDKYKSYNVYQSLDHSRITPDSLYMVTPVGRLVNVKILKVVGDDVYEDLRKDLEKHYKKNSIVQSVYISGGGTVMIDCRRL